MEGDPVPDYRPIRSYGWAAIELCVEDVMAVDVAMRGSPFDVIGPPLQIPGLPTIHPMQVRAPDAEAIYLTQILTDATDSGLPSGVRGIDRPFILVLACADILGTARWFADTLGMALDPPVAIRYRMIANAFGLPLEQLHTIATVRFDGDIMLPLHLTPYIIGLPHRIDVFKTLLADFAEHPATWFVTGADILASCGDTV